MSGPRRNWSAVFSNGSKNRYVQLLYALRWDILLELKRRFEAEGMAYGLRGEDGSDLDLVDCFNLMRRPSLENMT